MKASRELTKADVFGALALPVFLLVQYLDARLFAANFGVLTLGFMVGYFMVFLVLRRFSK
jgi:hypothetical protein